VAFVLQLRSDDRPILELLQSFWGCGRLMDLKPNSSVRNARPTSRFHIVSARDIRRVLIPHFERYPLYAKKAGDFAVWRTGVEMLVRIARRSRNRGRGSGQGFPKTWTERDREEFKAIIAALRQGRRCDAPLVAVQSPSPSPSPTCQGRLFDDD
jgi:hypothetical protein